jgi:putative methionine-R-sulfoxide reductase with GAF domain
MNDVIAAVASAADTESPREQRAATAAEIVRTARAYRWVGIYDVGDEDRTLIAQAGSGSPDGLHHSIDILGAESAVVIGTLDAQIDPPRAFGVEDFDFLGDCAAALRPLYD